MSEPEHSIVILPSVIRLLGTCAENLKEKAMMLTPSSSCMWVPLCSNRATCFFDTSHGTSGVGSLGSVAYLRRKASTKGNLVGSLLSGGL